MATTILVAMLLQIIVRVAICKGHCVTKSLVYLCHRRLALHAHAVFLFCHDDVGRYQIVAFVDAFVIV